DQWRNTLSGGSTAPFRTDARQTHQYISKVGRYTVGCLCAQESPTELKKVWNRYHSTSSEKDKDTNNQREVERARADAKRTPDAKPTPFLYWKFEDMIPAAQYP
ncbi:unnamed protein product, partial [Ectocarpus sp. 12 AP-2014]